MRRDYGVGLCVFQGDELRVSRRIRGRDGEEQDKRRRGLASTGVQMHRLS